MTDELETLLRKSLHDKATSTPMASDDDAWNEIANTIHSDRGARSSLTVAATTQPAPAGGDRRQRIVFSVAAAFVLIAAGFVWRTINNGDDGLVIADTNPAIQFGTPIELDLARTVNVKLPMAVSGDALIAGTSISTSESYQLEIVRVLAPNAEPETVLSVPVGGLLTMLEASGNTILAVVSQHVTSQLPVVFISTDGGDTWSDTELPAPTGAPLYEAAASDAAIGDNTLVVSGANGVWVSTAGVEWEFVEIFATDLDAPPNSWDWLSEITWTGDEFVIAGGVVDPTIADAADHNVAFWRSPDGVAWSDPEIVLVDEAIRTSDGAHHIVSDQQGRTLSLTGTQQWVNGRPDGTDRGTLVVVSEPDSGFSAEHLDDWFLYDAFAFDDGFLTAGVREGEQADPRFLFTVDGRTWTDVGPAPGMSSIGHVWGDHIVINGSRTESGNPNLTWALPVGENGEPLPPPITTTTVPGAEETATTQPAPTIGAIADEPPDGWISFEIPSSVANPNGALIWTGEEILLWGGQNDTVENTASGEPGAAFNPETATWRALSPGPKEATFGPGAVWTGEEMILCCGQNSSAAAAYSPTRDEWRTLSDSPISSEFTSAVWTGSAMLTATAGDVASYDPAADAWTTLTPPPSSLGRLRQAVWTGTELIIWPSAMDRSVSNGLAYDPTDDTWRTVPDPPAWPASPDIVWTGTHLVIWGALPSPMAEDSERGVGSMYDPTTNTWTELPEALPEPDGCECNIGSQTLLWTGTDLIVEPGNLATGIDQNTKPLLRLNTTIMFWEQFALSPTPEHALAMLSAGDRIVVLSDALYILE